MSGKTPDEFLDEGGAPHAKWKAVGDEVGGTVLFYEMKPVTDYDTGEELVWDKVLDKKIVASKASPGSQPLEQLVMTIQSEATGFTYEGLQYTRKELPDDDGQRRLYVRGALKAAIVRALKSSQSKLESGAYVKITRTADKKSDNPKYADAHQYTATWTPARLNSHPTSQANAFLGALDPGQPAASEASEAGETDPWA